MLDLSAQNAVDYLRQRGWPLASGARAETLDGGVSNLVLRVVNGAELLVLKQSRPQLRTRDAWYSDVQRIYREQEVMQVLEPLLPAETVPRVLFADRPNFIYAMSHAPVDARVWKSDLLAGTVDPSIGMQVGRVLGRVHELSARHRADFAAFADQRVFAQLRIDPFYRRVQERRPEVAQAVGSVIDEVLTRKEALCHGDYTPKNILVHRQGFTLVDYETAHFGDPAMDLGLFLAHVVLKALFRASQRAGYLHLARAFWQGYAGEIHFRPATELERRGVQHLGVCLLARIDGTSPVDYLPADDQRETIRGLGRAILHGQLSTWDEVLNACERAFAPFAGRDRA